MQQTKNFTEGPVLAPLLRFTIPVSLFSRLEPISLFCVGLATPCSTAVQILLFSGYFVLTSGKGRKEQLTDEQR